VVALDESRWIIVPTGQLEGLLERLDQRRNARSSSLDALSSAAQRLGMTNAMTSLVIAPTPRFREDLAHGIPVGLESFDSTLIDSLESLGVTIEVNGELVLEGVLETNDPAVAAELSEQLRELIRGIGSLSLPVGADVSTTVEVQESDVMCSIRLEREAALHALSRLMQGDTLTNRGEIIVH